MGLAYAQKRNYDEALPELEKAAQRRGTNSLASLGHVYGLMGRKKEAREVLSELKKRGAQKDVSDYQIALLHIGLDEADAATEALDQAYRERSTVMSYLKMDPRLDPLRSNPRFQELLRKMNFPQ